MHGRADEGKKQPWLLIKERDEFVRSASEFSLVDELPDSVRHLEDRPAATDGPPPGARKAALPAALQPQLATLVDEPPQDGDGWLYEVKFDGYRMLARAERGKVRLITRNGNDW